ncbi:hypothetical protein DFH11DRAFT_1744517 [Phellopilus nigrolimitatus]|nr:hypothetical protein DFH11DRAFT_1744517 [Phellopilus nigrolimitatus]
MPLFSDCAVHVVVDNEALKEYCTQTKGSSVTTWIESVSAKEFEISFKALNFRSSLQLKIHADGLHLKNWAYTLERDMGKKLVWDGIYVGENTYKPFAFGDVTQTDSDSAVVVHEDFGTICVEIRQVTYIENQTRGFKEPKMLPDAIHENNKKAGSHRIRLGEARKRITSAKILTAKPFDPLNANAIATFKFIYRPRGILQALGIIPCNDSNSKNDSAPPPPNEPSDSDAHTPKEFSNSGNLSKTNDVKVKRENVDTQLKTEGSSRARESTLRKLREEQAEIDHELAELEAIRRLKKREYSLHEQKRQAEIKLQVKRLEGVHVTKKVKHEHQAVGLVIDLTDD